MFWLLWFCFCRFRFMVIIMFKTSDHFRRVSLFDDQWSNAATYYLMIRKKQKELKRLLTLTLTNLSYIDYLCPKSYKGDCEPIWPRYHWSISGSSNSLSPICTMLWMKCVDCNCLHTDSRWKTARGDGNRHPPERNHETDSCVQGNPTSSHVRSVSGFEIRCNWLFC